MAKHGSGHKSHQQGQLKRRKHRQNIEAVHKARRKSKPSGRVSGSFQRKTPRHSPTDLANLRDSATPTPPLMLRERAE